MKSGSRPSVCRLQSALCQHARLAALLTSPVRSRRYLRPTRSTSPLHLGSGGVSQVKPIQEEVQVQAWFQNAKQRSGDHLCVTMPTPPEPSSCQSEQQCFVLRQQNNRQTRQKDDVLQNIKPSSVIQSESVRLSPPSHTQEPQNANTATHPEDSCGHFCGTQEVHTDCLLHGGPAYGLLYCKWPLGADWNDLVSKH